MPFRQLQLAFSLLLIALPSYAQSVIRDGREWLQPVDFVNLSWNDVAAVCPPPAGACNGTLGATNLTGFTWASVDDVIALINSYGVSPPLSGISTVSQIDSQWAPGIIAHFLPTDSDPTQGRFVGGWSRTEYLGIAAKTIGIYDLPPGLPDSASTEFIVRKNLQFPREGAWFFRLTPPASIPTLPLYGLLGTVLGLCLLAVRRLSSSKAHAA